MSDDMASLRTAKKELRRHITHTLSRVSEQSVQSQCPYEAKDPVVMYSLLAILISPCSQRYIIFFTRISIGQEDQCVSFNAARRIIHQVHRH